jgi:ABC-2 type transport system permease protein
MSAGSGRLAVVAAIVGKDLRSFARDRLWVVLTPFSLVFAVGAFWLTPSTVNDSITVGIHPPDAVALLDQLEAEDAEGIVLLPFEDADRLVAAVQGDLEDGSEAEDKVGLGIAFPHDFSAALREGRPTEVTLHLTATVPESLRLAFAGEVRELGFTLQAVLTGQAPEAALPVTFPDEGAMVLGEDRAGAQVPMRDKLRPMMAIFILMLGTIAIAGLVAVEIEHRTVTAMLVTPARCGDLLAAKAITGVLLGAGQGLIFLAVTASLGTHWPLVVALMLEGALMMAALGLIAGTAGRDFMSTMFLAVALIVPMAAPTFAVLFPGSTSLPIRLMPSWGFTETMVGLIGYGRPPAELLLPLLTSVGWTAALLGLSLLLLRRRVEAL